ncbi:YitT family protein [Kutzneria sp. 744]|uniref:YczE/YyaS/YitT family protein n=1 Tax=Kutzneria sp. (strain 744) TaxID=345341 RepID=UPI0003EEB8F0|nr:hypothetical protein [Kutzneria sp. 744]EWM19774.1 integral membrane protein [Kutzneria sp. 744]
MNASVITVRRWAQLLLGAAAIGWGIAAMITAHAGYLPWDVWHVALTNWLHDVLGADATVGGGVIATAALALIVSVVLGEPVRPRTLPGLLVGLIVPGVCTDFALTVLPATDALAGRVGYLLGGAVVFAAGSAAMVGCGLGAGPRDRVMQALLRRGLSVRRARIGMDVLALLAGMVLAGVLAADPLAALEHRQVWVGTVVVAVAVGLLVALLLPRLSIDKGDAERASAGAGRVRRRSGRHRAPRRRRAARVTRRPAASGPDLMAGALSSVTVLADANAGAAFRRRWRERRS